MGHSTPSWDRQQDWHLPGADWPLHVRTLRLHQLTSGACRGQGELIGKKQSGKDIWANLRIARLPEHADVLEEARAAAATLVGEYGAPRPAPCCSISYAHSSVPCGAAPLDDCQHARCCQRLQWECQVSMHSCCHLELGHEGRQLAEQACACRQPGSVQVATRPVGGHCAEPAAAAGLIPRAQWACHQP